MEAIKRKTLVFVFVCLVAVCAEARVITVDDDGPADFNNIQAAINDSNDGDVIEVKPGTYTGDGNRDIDFGGKAITLRSESGAENCIIDCQGTYDEPHRGFYFHSGEDANSIIDGLKIINGYAPVFTLGPFSYYLGGGIYCSDDSNPTVANCILSGNTAENGGGLCNWGSCPTVVNCTFSGNAAVVINPLGGYPYGLGGGMFNCFDGSPAVINCILWGNTDVTAGYENYQIYTISGTPEVDYSCIQDLPGDLGGIGNIANDPCFADPCNGDYHLQSAAGRWDANSESWVTDASTSPCIDAGNPGCALADEPADANNIRINMGAYGGTPTASKTPADWRSIADLTNDWSVDFTDLAVFVDYWLESGDCVPSDLDRSESADFVDFDILGENWLAGL